MCCSLIRVAICVAFWFSNTFTHNDTVRGIANLLRKLHFRGVVAMLHDVAWPEAPVRQLCFPRCSDGHAPGCRSLVQKKATGPFEDGKGQGHSDEDCKHYADCMEDHGDPCEFAHGN